MFLTKSISTDIKSQNNDFEVSQIQVKIIDRAF